MARRRPRRVQQRQLGRGAPTLTLPALGTARTAGAAPGSAGPSAAGGPELADEGLAGLQLRPPPRAHVVDVVDGDEAVPEVRGVTRSRSEINSVVVSVEKMLL